MRSQTLLEPFSVFSAHRPALPSNFHFFRLSLNFQASAKFYDSAFCQPFSLNFSLDSRNQKHFLMLNMSINIDWSIKYVISTEFKLQIQFVTFIRGHPGTPIDPAPVLLSGKPCSMLGPAVNRQPGFRRELVEQSNRKQRSYRQASSLLLTGDC